MCIALVEEGLRGGVIGVFVGVYFKFGFRSGV